MKQVSILFNVVLVACGVYGADVLETFYWTGTQGGRWSDVANWSTDAKGTTPASRYPGGDPTNHKLDQAWFVQAATGTILVDGDVSVARLCVAQGSSSSNPRSIVFTSGGDEVHSISITYNSDSYSWRSRIEAYNTALFTNLVMNVRYLDVYGYATFGQDLTLNINKCVRQYNNNARLTIDPGATVTIANKSVLEYRLNSPAVNVAGEPITINGGTISSVGTGRIHLLHHGTRLLYRGGTITCPMTIGTVSRKDYNDPGAILTVGAGVTLNSDGLLTFDGGVLVNEEGGVLNVNQPLTITSYMAIGPYDKPGSRGTILTMDKSVGDLAALNIRQDQVNSFSHQFQWGVDVENDVQSLWVEGNAYPKVKDATTGYVKQILGSSSNIPEQNNPMGRADAWSDGLYPHSDTNYASAGYSSTYSSNIVFSGGSYTLDGSGLFRLMSANRRITVADFRLGTGNVSGASRPSIITTGGENYNQYLAGKLTIFCKKSASYLPYIGGGNANHAFVIESQLVGDETTGFEVRRYTDKDTNVEDATVTNRVRFVGDTSAYFGRVLVRKDTRRTIGSYPFPGEVLLGAANHGLAVDETVSGTAILGQLSTATNVTTAAVEVPAERTLAVTNGLSLISHLVKNGAGTLALGGSAVWAGEDARLDVAAGSVKPLSAQAVGVLPVTFGAGAGLVLDWSPADAVVVAKGLDLSACPTATFASTTVPVKFDLDDTQAARKPCRKALLTVKEAVGEDLNLSVDCPKGYTLSVTSETTGGLTTFYADFVPKGMMILVK